MDSSTKYRLENSYLENIEKLLGTGYNQYTPDKEGAPSR
mgnify:CR=1 FL=1